ncbi:hypothetical protein J7T55_004011 [Diaporthe amygdali]|uniref:uncharacterized protein n=1 Tax=Phomopsis amygdali TaxID=1214568 RepID=UPI0022FDD6BE|nr:uncharacterized protein J7T55_004011 [Diaporthe amygdali]KAJ0115842.1 hypothetical protein J7T55_004011 [Diaporthe amygdali]
MIVSRKTTNQSCSGTRAYCERTSSGFDICGCAAPSDNSTIGRDNYFNGNTTASQLDNFDIDTAADKLVNSTSGSAAVKLDHLVSHTTARSTGAAVTIPPTTNEANNGGSGGGNRLDTADFIGIAIGAGVAIVLLIAIIAAAVILWRRKSLRSLRSRPRDSDALPIARAISPQHQSLHAPSEHYSVDYDSRGPDEPWAMSGAQPTMTETAAPQIRGTSWFKLPSPVRVHSGRSSTWSRPGPATSLHSHPLVRKSSDASVSQHSNRSSGGVPRVVRQSSSTYRRPESPPNVSIDRQARGSESASLGSLSSEAERHLAVGQRGDSVVGASNPFDSQRGSGTSSAQRQPMALLPVFQQPVYAQLPGNSGAIVELI